MPERVGFIGLGIMGRGMAANLLEAGHDLVVHNRTPERMAPFAERGAATADSPRELAATADIIITCVSDTPDVDQVLFGPDGVAAGVRPGSLIIDMSTISPAATRFFATRLADREVDYLDAPVSGGSEGAERGTLNIMVGGTEAALARARPYLRAMGSKITHVGPVGAGQTCKLVNQILVVVNMLGVAEGLLLAQAGGLDLHKTVEAVSGGAAGSWMLDNRAPQVIERYWKPGFTVDLQQKDLRLVLETADAAGVPLLGTSLVSQLYRTLQRSGEGGDGNHALAKALERLSGVTIGADTGSGKGAGTGTAASESAAPAAGDEAATPPVTGTGADPRPTAGTDPEGSAETGSAEPERVIDLRHHLPGATGPSTGPGTDAGGGRGPAPGGGQGTGLDLGPTLGPTTAAPPPAHTPTTVPLTPAHPSPPAPPTAAGPATNPAAQLRTHLGDGEEPNPADSLSTHLATESTGGIDLDLNSPGPAPSTPGDPSAALHLDGDVGPFPETGSGTT